MENNPPVVDVPAVASDAPKYSRAAMLFVVIETAAMQLRQDALNEEQEPMALASRLLAIQQAVETISQNDLLLRGR